MIRNPNEIQEGKKKIRMLIAGYPGIGKSTLALSAPRPLHIDVDFGIDRIEPRYRKPYIQPKSYDEILEDLIPENLESFDTLVFEAKYTDRDRMEKRRITKAQEDYLNLHQSVGALCFVLVGFGSGRVYRIPWSVWKDMAVCFGREYVREEDLQSFRVHGGSYGVQLDILGDVG